MATAILKYNLNDSDDMMEFHRVSQATDMALALWQIAYNLRKKVEWEIDARGVQNIENGTDEYIDPVDIMMENINSILEEHNINVDKLMR